MSSKSNNKSLISISEHDPWNPQLVARKILAFPRFGLQHASMHLPAPCPEGSKGIGNGLILVHYARRWMRAPLNAFVSAIAHKPIYGSAVVQHTPRRLHTGFKVRRELEDEARAHWKGICQQWQDDVDLIWCGRHWWFVQQEPATPAEGRLLMLKVLFGHPR